MGLMKISKSVQCWGRAKATYCTNGRYGRCANSASAGEIVGPNDKCEDAAGNQRKPQVLWHVWMIGGADPRHLLQAFEELDDREPEADQRDCGPDPRQHRAFEAQAS